VILSLPSLLGGSCLTTPLLAVAAMGACQTYIHDFCGEVRLNCLDSSMLVSLSDDNPMVGALSLPCFVADRVLCSFSLAVARRAST